jgi:hypothetical protein
MPTMQLATSMMNVAFSADGLGEFGDSTDAFNPCNGLTLPEALARVPHLTLPRPVLRFLAQWPSALQAAVQGIIWENFNRSVTVPITFAWQPAYDYSITVHDVYDTPKTRGGITIVFTSRYPDDTHPLSSKARKAR